MCKTFVISEECRWVSALTLLAFAHTHCFKLSIKNAVNCWCAEISVCLRETSCCCFSDCKMRAEGRKHLELHSLGYSYLRIIFLISSLVTCNSASFIRLFIHPPFRPCFSLGSLSFHHSIFSGSMLSRSISGEATQQKHSFWVNREILSAVRGEKSMRKMNQDQLCIFFFFYPTQRVI